MATTHSILKDWWGYDAFRPMQEEIIHSILAGSDTLALMPTGGGKSLCYQVPAMAKPGLCLVISPLIALMKDQVENLRKKGITAYAIYSGMAYKEVVTILKTATDSNCKFLYVSPERLETNLFKEYLPALQINLIAVDEAHCISQWGYDFRPPYLRIAALREEVRGVPILALTASATPDVQKDICEKLHFTNPQLFQQSFERANLSFSVFKVEAKINKILEILNKVPGSALVYCRSRKRTKEIAERLLLNGIRADFYHAGLPQEQRHAKQEAWVKNEKRVIVCTNAFGMGIDKPDVRVVIHADVPDCLENYYQEAGRAGRDGKNAFAVLLHDETDISELENMTAIRFPSLEAIREVYQAVCNYLQVPSQSAENSYYDFDLNDFIKKFKLNSHTVMYALKALEQEDWLSFNEQVFLPSQVQFTTSKDALYDFEQTHPESELLIKTLLRTYAGIFDTAVFISEKMIARLLNKEAEAIKQELAQLHRQALLDYQPQKDSPQIYFIRNRVKAEELQINAAAYEKRKEVFSRRAKQMIAYIREKIYCRSKMIGQYFGDSKLPKCNVCDNCLSQKALVLTKEEFAKIALRIETLLRAQPLPAKDLLLGLSGIKKEKAWKVIDFLQGENKIEMDKSGWVRWR